MADFDLFVIGAGSGGVRTARMAASYGANVAIAEDRYMGGTCVNVGCIPKKLYSYAAHFNYDFEDSRGFGWKKTVPEFDWGRLRDNKTTEIHRLNGIYKSILDNANVRLMEGRAKIIDSHSVQVNGKVYSADNILIATGGWPFIPDFPGNDLVVTSNEIFDLEVLPKRILIVGGGYIAVEFAGIFAGLGSKSTLSYRGTMPLRGFDEDIRSKFFSEISQHVDMKMESNVEKIIRQADDTLLVSFVGGSVLEVECVLYATGRNPNTVGLGLENVNIATHRNGTLIVDENYQTSEPSIYALGDIIGRVALTPVALAEGMALAQALFTDTTRPVDYNNIATAVFSHPNIGTVGLSEGDAKTCYANIAVFESDFKHLKHTLSGRQERTYMKVIVNQDNDKVLGIHMMGADAGEIIQGFGVAMTCGLTKFQLDSTIGIHPTAAEELVTMRVARKAAGEKLSKS